MINEEPNYSDYSLDELKCALDGLDEDRFPERGALIRSLISKKSKRLKSESENEIARAQEFLEQEKEGEHTFLITCSSSGSKTALLIGNLPVILFFTFFFVNEPTWLLGGIIALMTVAAVGLFEHVTGQLKVSFDRGNLNITQLGFKFFRRNKTIPLNEIKSVSQNTTSTSVKGIPVNTYSLQAHLKNGSVQRLTVLKSEREGLYIADAINRVITNVGTD